MVENVYLNSTQFIDFEDKKIQEIICFLISEESGKINNVINIFNFVRDDIKYSIDMTLYTNQDDFKASVTLERKKGFCVPKALLLTTLLRAAGFPSRLHFADIINHRSPKYLQELMGSNLFFFHGYSEVFLNDRWIKLTPTFNKDLCEKHAYPLCEFSGSNDATFPSKDLNNSPFIEYINDRGTYADLPFIEMMRVFQKYYDETRIEKE